MSNYAQLRLPNDDDPELQALVDRYVVAEDRYMRLLHGNFLRMPAEGRSAFLARLRSDAETITDQDLATLLSSEWRSRITASWLIADSRRTRFVQQLGDLLLASDLVFAGQGYCVALGRIGGEVAALHLGAHLDQWLPQVECRFDQSWAMAALIELDERDGSRYSTRFLQPGGLWQTWARGVSGVEERIRVTRQLIGMLEHDER